MRYKHRFKENRFDVYSGTGTLYARLDDKHYIVATAAHNLVSMQMDMVSGEPVFTNPDKIYFYLQRSGKQNYKARFRMKYHEIYPEYKTYEKHNDHRNDGYLGCDVGLICVELDDEMNVNDEVL